MRRSPVILVTGFEPFGGSPENPSELLVRRIGESWQGNARLVASVLPVTGGDGEGGARAVLDALLSEHRPDACVLFGEAHQRGEVSVERIAVNLRDYRMADNAGTTVRDEPVVRGAPDARFATLPVYRIIDAVRASGVPAGPSMTAGTFLCNEVMFHVLERSARDGVPRMAGFVHLPQLASQHRMRPCDARPMSEEEVVRAGTAVLDAVSAEIMEETGH